MQLSTLALVLPLLVQQVSAAGGDHYVPHRSTNANPAVKRDANPDPAGGDHYVPHRSANKNPVKRSLWNVWRKSSSATANSEAERNVYDGPLDERGLPITATTTITVPVTVYETIWVDETAAAPLVTPTASASTATGTDAPGSTATGTDAPSSTITDSLLSTATELQPTVSTGSAAPNATTTDPLLSTVTERPGSSATDSAASTSTDSLLSTLTEVLTTATASITDSAVSSSATGTNSTWIVDPTSTTAAPTTETGTLSEETPIPTSSSAFNQTLTTAEPTSTTASNTDSLTESVLPTSTAANESTATTTASNTDSETTATVSPTSTSSSPAISSTSVVTPVGDTIMCGYYADWSASTLPPESIDWSKFDVVDFAFAEPDASGGLDFTQDDSKSLLQRLVSGAHGAGKKVKVSVGGWTGSAHFSTLTASSSQRATFIKNIVSMVNTYNLDGIDIDWEYPGAAGADGNAVSGSDSANFLVFLTELRAALPSGSLITAATQVWPFYDSNGNPMTDVSAFAKVLDWILIMNYDIWGSSKYPGPNAPLADGCKNSTQPTANAYSSVASWTAAGFPANQITLGVPAYGYIQVSSATQLYQRSWRGMPLTAKRASDVTVQNTEGGTSTGQVMFEGLVAQGALVLENGAYVGAGGFTRHWDSCSSTPWLKSSSSGQIVTYDDTESMNLKGQFAKQAGIKGCNVFSMDGDFVSGSWPLTNAVRSGMGI